MIYYGDFTCNYSKPCCSCKFSTTQRSSHHGRYHRSGRAGFFRSHCKHRPAIHPVRRHGPGHAGQFRWTGVCFRPRRRHHGQHLRHHDGFRRGHRDEDQGSGRQRGRTGRRDGRFCGKYDHGRNGEWAHDDGPQEHGGERERVRVGRRDEGVRRRHCVGERPCGVLCRRGSQ